MIRLLTAAAGIPIVLGIVGWGPGWMLASLVGLVGCLGFGEFMALARGRGLAPPGAWSFAAALGVTLAFAYGPGGALAGLVVAVLLLVAVSTALDATSVVMERAAVGVMGLVYVSFLLGFILLLPRAAIVVLLGIVWLGDTAAYYGGRLWGRLPLAPAISPKKTVEGALAGAAGSVVGGVLLSLLLLDSTVPGAALLSLGVGVAGQIGDLAESAIKRGAGVKDSGGGLPGHGGFLDRIDSLLFAAPVFYIFSRIVGL